MNYFIDMKKLLIVFVCLSGIAVNAQQVLPGFSAEGSKVQTEIENKFDALLRKENIEERIRIMADKVHYVGTPYGKQNAEYMVEQFRSWGFDAQLETFYVLFPKPKVRILEIPGDKSYKPTLDEKPLPEDPYTLQKGFIACIQCIFGRWRCHC